MGVGAGLVGQRENRVGGGAGETPAITLGDPCFLYSPFPNAHPL